MNGDGRELRADDGELRRLRTQNAELEKEIAPLRHALETALTHSADFNYVFDLNGRFTYANRPLLSLWQKTFEEAVGKTVSELDYPPDLAERVQQQIQQVIDTKQMVRDETPYTATSGIAGTYEYIFVPVIGPNGSVEAVSGSTRDITARKRTEDALRESEERFSAAFAHAPVGMVLTTPEGHCVEVNQAYLDLLGVTREELVSVGFDHFTHPDDLLPTHRFLEALRTDANASTILEKRYIRKDGRIVWVRAWGTIRRDRHGQPTELIAIIEDITERKRIERALAAKDEHLQQVFMQAPVAIVVFRGHDLVIELANPFYQAMLPGRQLVGRRFKDVIPELEQPIWDALHRVLDTGEPFIASEWLIPYDQNGTGVLEDAWFNCVFHPLREPDGKVSGMVVVCSDVSAQVRARGDLERANKELEEFAYVASHDLQEPLRMVNIYTQLMARELQPHLNDDSRGFAAQVGSGVKRMEQLLKDLLNFSHVIHTGQDEPRALKSADLNASLAQALGTLQNRIEAEGAVIAVDPLPAVRGDQAQLAQVFQNLISNALKYRKAGEPAMIEINSRRAGNESIVSVKDCGIGFPQDQAERVFGLFKRLHKDEYPGTGLGLAICKRIVERFGGRIWADSAPGEGSTFYFALPEVTKQ